VPKNLSATVLALLAIIATAVALSAVYVHFHLESAPGSRPTVIVDERANDSRIEIHIGDTVELSLHGHWDVTESSENNSLVQVRRPETPGAQGVDIDYRAARAGNALIQATSTGLHPTFCIDGEPCAGPDTFGVSLSIIESPSHN